MHSTSAVHGSVSVNRRWRSMKSIDWSNDRSTRGWIDTTSSKGLNCVRRTWVQLYQRTLKTHTRYPILYSFNPFPHTTYLLLTIKIITFQTYWKYLSMKRYLLNIFENIVTKGNCSLLAISSFVKMFSNVICCRCINVYI